MQTQVELELEAYQFGKARMAAAMRGNEEKGRAHNNPYAQAVYRRFVLPLAEIIREDLAAKRVGRRRRVPVAFARQLVSPADAVGVRARRAADVVRVMRLAAGLPGRSPMSLCIAVRFTPERASIWPMVRCARSALTWARAGSASM